MTSATHPDAVSLGFQVTINPVRLLRGAGPVRGVCHVVIGLALTLAGCQRSMPPSSSEAGIRPAPGSSSTVRSAPAPSKVEGDRLAGTAASGYVLTKQTEPSPFRFTEIAGQAGIDFVHFSGMTRDKYFPTANSSGVALFDYDGDGLLDLYFATCTALPVGSATHGPNRLYKNLGGNSFQDVTTSSGLGFRGFCNGILVGDIDNDGDQDVFLANFGPNALFLNNGDGTFRDIAASAGVDRPNNWSYGGAFLDYDNDGDLDLFVANYGEWVLPRDDVFCGDRDKGIRLYCSPRSIRTGKHTLYRNDGDRTFTDVTDAAGVGRADGHGFGVVTTDLDGDGRIDIYVANDLCPNFLFLNRGDGTFRDATESSGTAYGEKGEVQGSMGVDAEDVNGDGRPDLFVTNFAHEAATLYLNLGKGLFLDSTPRLGLAADTMPFVGWGCALADFDNDGWPDCFVSNGHVDDNRRELGQAIDYEEPALLFRNLGGRRFRLATLEAGPYFDAKHVGRGVAFGDFDNDGDIDIVVNHKDRPPALLRNDSKTANHWIRVELRGRRSNRDAVGARVEVVAGGRTIYRQRKGGYSMESAHDPRLLIGVGQADVVTRLTVRWPSGAVSLREHLKVDQTYKIEEP